MADPIVGCIAFVWATAWAGFAARRALAGSRQLVYPLALVCWIFFALPIGLDLAYRPLRVSLFPRVDAALADPTVEYVYHAFVGTLLPLLIWVGRTPRLVPTSHAPKGSPLFTMVTFATAMALPAVAVAMSAEPSVYLEYAISQRDAFSDEVAASHSLVALTARVSTLLVGVGLLRAPRLTAPLMFLAVTIMVADVWVTGKRSAVALALMITLFALWDRGVIRGRALIAITSLSGVALLLYSAAYQGEYREDSSLGAGYDSFRIDYARDAEVKTAIFSDVNRAVDPILPEGVSTLVLYLSTYVPRELWPDKPIPYAQYYTSAALDAPPQEWGWGLTTSIFGEWVSNLGLVGLPLSVIFLGVLARWVSSSGSGLVRILGVATIILLAIQHVTAFYPVFAAWVILRAHESLRSRSVSEPSVRGSVAAQGTSSARPSAGGAVRWTP